MTEFEQLSNGNGNTYNSNAVNMVFQGPSTENTYNKVAVNPVLQGQCTYVCISGGKKCSFSGKFGCNLFS